MVGLLIGVTLGPDGLVDPVRAASVPVNRSGRAALECLDSHDIRGSAELIAARFSVDPDRAEQDIEALCRRLKGAGLLNVRLTGTRTGRARACASRWLTHVATGRVPARRFGVHRITMDTRTVRSVLVSGTRALLPAVLWQAAATALLVLLLLGGLGGASLAPVLAIVGGGAGGVLVNELGHALALRSVPAAVDGLRPAVIHGPVPDRRLAVVTAAGPLAGMLAGLGALALAGLVHSGTLALLAIVLMGQGAGLTVLSRDGRKLCRLL